MGKVLSSVLIILLIDVDVNVNYKDNGFFFLNKSNFYIKLYLYSCLVDFKFGEDGKYW